MKPWQPGKLFYTQFFVSFFARFHHKHLKMSIMHISTLSASEDFRFLDVSLNLAQTSERMVQKNSLNKRLRFLELQAKPVLLLSSSLIHQAIFLFNVWGIYLEAILIWVSNGLQVDWFTAQTFSKSSRSMERNKEKKIQWPIHLRCRNFAFRSFFCF